MRSVFITGATGFVGAALVRHFHALNWKVIAQGRGDPPPGLSAVAEYVQADIARAIPRVRADVAVHAAALASDSASWEQLYAANVLGTRHVLEACGDCRCLVYVSSSSVYDFTSTVHEESEPCCLGGLSAYGRSKRIAEDWLLSQEWSGRPLFVLRPRAVYGPGDRVLLPRLLRLVRGGSIWAPGGMLAKTSLTHVRNLCEAVQLCAEREDGGSRVYNVADLTPYSMAEAVKAMLEAVAGRALQLRDLPLAPLVWSAKLLETLRVPSNFTPYSLAAVTKDNVLDIQSIRRELGYVGRADVWGALPEMAAWAKQVGLHRIALGEAGLPWEVVNMPTSSTPPPK
jgi:Nucleoside-diphosphate-sugar epimerases